MSDADKDAKGAVAYRRAVPFAPERCGSCCGFRPDQRTMGDEGRCAWVRGVVRTRDVCDRWQAAG